MRRRPSSSWLLLAAVVFAGGCTGGGSSAGTSTATGTIVVSAAASLRDAFEGIAAEYEAANPGVRVVLNLGASSALREQILEGAPVDVFASANMANMDPLVDEGMIEGAPVIFASNAMVIAVPNGNPGGVTGLPDFARDDLLVGLCQPEVPCGSLARDVLSSSGVVPLVDTEEPNVRALLTKVEAGELDAAITYLTDIASAGGAVEGIAIPDVQNATSLYPIATLARTSLHAEASGFVAFVLSDAGQAILARHGFTPP